LNRMLLAVLQIAQVALIVVVVVYAAKDIRKGVSHRVLLGSLVALVVLVAVTPLVTNAAVVEGMKKKTSLVKAATKAGKEESKTPVDRDAEYHRTFDQLEGNPQAIKSYIHIQTTDFDNLNASRLIKDGWATQAEINQERRDLKGFVEWYKNHSHLKVPTVDWNESPAARYRMMGYGG
jgi:hypothetical protein